MDIYDGHIPTIEEISYMETKYEPSSFEDTWEDEFLFSFSFKREITIQSFCTHNVVPLCIPVTSSPRHREATKLDFAFPPSPYT